MKAARAVCQIEMVGEQPYGKVAIGISPSHGMAASKLSDSNSRSTKAHRKYP